MIKEMLIKNGGLTLNKKGQPIILKTGYQVSIYDCAKILLKDFNDKIVKQLADKINRGEYVGLWIDGGYVYADISKRIATKKDAYQKGKELKQLAIFNWKRNESLYL